jgi:hypothetical protein
MMLVTRQRTEATDESVYSGLQFPWQDIGKVRNGTLEPVWLTNLHLQRSKGPRIAKPHVEFITGVLSKQCIRDDVAGKSIVNYRDFALAWFITGLSKQDAVVFERCYQTPIPRTGFVV